MKTVIFVIGILCLVGSGAYLSWSGYDSYTTEFNHTNALANLREYQVAQYMYRDMSGYEFAHKMMDLYKSEDQPGMGDMVKKEIAMASDSNSTPEPYRGYLFKDLTTDESGSEIDFQIRCGLCAYPAEPGDSGTKLLVILMDDSTIELDENGMSGSPGYTLWSAPYETIGGPLKHFPSYQYMKENFTCLNLTLEKGRQKIQEEYDKFKDMSEGR